LKASFVRTQSFYSSKESPNLSPLASKINDSGIIITKLRKFQQVDPLGSLLSMSKSSTPQIHQDQLNRNIINHGLPKSRTPNSHRTILKKKTIRKESDSSGSSNMISSLRKKTNFSIKNGKSQEFFGLKREKSQENFTSLSMISIPGLKKGQSIENSPNHENVNRNGENNSQSDSSDDQPLINFEKVKNFAIYYPQNNVDTLINLAKANGPLSPKRNRRKAELMLKFKEVVNTVRNSKKLDFSKKNGSLIKGFHKVYLNNEDFEAKNEDSSIMNDKNERILKLERVVIDQEGIQGKIGLANIMEEENEWVSHERGSFMQPLERSMPIKDSFH